MLTGACAQAYAALKGLDYKGNGIVGTGALAAINQGRGLSEPAQMIQAAQELSERPAQTQAMGILPADVPDSDPVLASAPQDPPVSELVPPRADRIAQMPAAPDPMKSPAVAAMAQVVARVDADAAPKPARKRRTKAEIEAAASEIAALVVAPVTEPAAVAAVEPTSAVVAVDTPIAADNRIFFYVGCRPHGVPCDSLAPVIDELCSELAAANGVDDIRVAEKGVLGFGKWAAVLGSLILELGRAGEITGGHWTLDMVGSIAEVVADAMRRLCAETGGVYVR